jgi:hypothetical protein
VAGKKSIGDKLKDDAKTWVKGAKAGAKTLASIAPVGAGVKIGATAGKAIARAVAKESSPKVLRAANIARGSGKMVNPKPAMGAKTRTAAKRDVIVKTQDKTLATNKFINTRGEKSIKVQTKKPTVRFIEKEVTPKKAAQQTSSSNKLRYGASKKEAERMRNAVSGSKILEKGGKVVGAIAGTSPAIAKTMSKKKK